MNQVPDANDESTRDAASRLIAFLRGELAQLPVGHPWRRHYARQLIRMTVHFPAEAEQHDEGRVSELG